MRLYVYVLQAKELPVNDSYVKIQVGKFKSKTRILKNTNDPVWNEEFVFRVHDVVEEEVVVSVFHHEDDGGFFSGSRKLIGRVRIPVKSIAGEDNQTLPPTWFSIENPKNSKLISPDKDCGKILLTMSLHGKGYDNFTNHIIYEESNIDVDDPVDFEGSPISSHKIVSSKVAHKKIPEPKQIVKAITNRVGRLFSKDDESSRNDTSTLSTLSDYEDCAEEHFSSSSSFEEALELMMQSMDGERETPDNLTGGILIDRIYAVSSYDLNILLFAPDSQFRKELAEIQGTTDVVEGPWEWKSGDTSCLSRVVGYTRSATKLVKSVRATEEQTYIKAEEQQFVIYVSVSTPEVPYGHTFKVELLYKIIPGPELPSGEESSRLVVSWGICFHHNTMMKGMIEGGVKQGLKDSFDQFADLLDKKLKVVDSLDSLDKDHVLASLEAEQQSDWESATQYFLNFTVVSSIIMGLYVVMHIILCEPNKPQGLELYGFDLPDSFGELFTCWVLFIQFEHVFKMISHFVEARLRRGSDHGTKAHGDGWVLTVALVEGSNLASMQAEGFSDPYVVFTCNGKTRTSSVKLQEQDPQWNEILEFDAMEEPPSVLNVEVFDFDGPFDQATSLGHAEINFLKHSATELADLWIPLEGKLAQSSHSKLHLRIFLDNKKGVETVKEYLTKMEKEVGKKLNLRSPHRNSTFQKLFGLPPEEFLISDYSCYLKRKMPLQGRIFLSARIVGFYANLFGHKTKFFFLWEDIDDIEVLPPSLASVGSPSLIITLRKGRGLDARHGAKSLDENGRLLFHFQSFVSFNVACKTIMALWRTRTLSPDQRAQIAEEQQDEGDSLVMLEDGGTIFDVDETKMSKIYSAELPVNVNSLMEMFDGGEFERKIMERAGCLSYVSTPWEPVRPGVSERRLSYKFNRHVSIFGGEVSCTQQKLPISNDEGWILNEVMALHDVPFADHFHVHFRYRIEKSVLAHNACKCDVDLAVTWLKSTHFQSRIGRNIKEKFTHRFEEIFELVEREIVLRIKPDEDNTTLD